MILSFKDPDTCELYETGENRRFASIARVALRKLDMIAAATRVETLRVPWWMSLPISSVCSAADSMTRSSRPASAASFFMTNSAIGERQMFPWQTKRIFVCLLCFTSFPMDDIIPK